MTNISVPTGLPAVEAHSLVKNFADLRAVDGVDLTVHGPHAEPITGTLPRHHRRPALGAHRKTSTSSALTGLAGRSSSRPRRSALRPKPRSG